MGAPLIDLMQFTSVVAAVLDRGRKRPREIAVERPSALGAAWEKNICFRISQRYSCRRSWLDRLGA